MYIHSYHQRYKVHDDTHRCGVVEAPVHPQVDPQVQGPGSAAESAETASPKPRKTALARKKKKSVAVVRDADSSLCVLWKSLLFVCP